jgi:DNA-binding GntR family transcriptional regulator
MAKNALVPDEVETTQSKSEIAYQWIKQRISSGGYSSGYRLVLSNIAKELDVSTVPVREAIRRLEAEGLVTFERNVGAQVAMLDPAEYVYTMQTLSVIEGAATSLSAPHITVEAIAQARATNVRMRECLDNFDPHRFTELNHEFHLALFEKCPNPHLLDLVFRGWDRLRTLRDSTFAFIPGRPRESVAEHDQLLQIIEAKAAPIQIELAARAHRMATLNAFLAYQAGHNNPPPNSQGRRKEAGEYR